MSKWPKKRVGDLVDVLSGFAFDSAYFGDSGDLPIVRIRDVVPGKSSTYYRGQFDERYIIRNGDVLIGMDGEFNRARWRGGDALLNQRVCRIASSSGDLDDAYLFHFLPAALKAIERVTPFVTVKHLSVKQIREIAIPLPPPSEQRRIAEILDKADALRDKRRAAIAQLDALTQFTFLYRFIKAGEFASEPLDSVCELITDGTHYTPTYSETGVIFLSSRNVTSGYIDWDDVKFIPEGLHKELERRVSPRRNDILLAKNGTTGIAAIVDRDCVFDIYVSLALLRASDRVLPIFLREAINSPLCTRQFNASLKGIGVPNLHLKEIRRTQIPIPPIELQRRFVEQVEEIEAQRRAQHMSRAKLTEFLASLQQRALRGEL